MPPIITLTTDFGLSDPYVASMKGVICGINPEARIIDVSHDIRPQAIEQGVFLLEYALPYLPKGAVHVMVVDPGVGTRRRAVALITPDAAFVAPDNGLLSAALPEEVRASCGDGPALVDLPDGYRAYELTNDVYHRKPVSVTFHGRDIFSPVAAHLTLGVPPEDLGPRIQQVLAVRPFVAQRRDDGLLVGRIVHVDRYGNLITDVHGYQIAAGDVAIEVGGRMVRGVSRTYADSDRLTAIVASTGLLAVVTPNGSAARDTGAGIGDPVTVRTGKERGAGSQ